MTRPPEPTEAEEAQLRLALRMIGDEADRDTPAALLPTPPRARRKRRTALLTAVAVAATCALALLLTTGHDTDPSDNEAGRPGADGGQAQTGAEYLACARTIVQGDILRVRKAHRDGRVLLTLDVKKWIKPTHGKQRIELDLLDPVQARNRPPFKPQQNALLVIPRRNDMPADVYGPDRKERVHTLLNRDLPRSAHTTCPPYWKHTSATPTIDIPNDA